MHEIYILFRHHWLLLPFHTGAVVDTSKICYKNLERNYIWTSASWHAVEFYNNFIAPKFTDHKYCRLYFSSGVQLHHPSLTCQLVVIMESHNFSIACHSKPLSAPLTFITISHWSCWRSKIVLLHTTLQKSSKNSHLNDIF